MCVAAVWPSIAIETLVTAPAPLLPGVSVELAKRALAFAGKPETESVTV